MGQTFACPPPAVYHNDYLITRRLTRIELHFATLLTKWHRNIGRGACKGLSHDAGLVLFWKVLGLRLALFLLGQWS